MENIDIKKAKTNILKYKHFIWISMYGFCQIWFTILEKRLVPKYYMYSVIDSFIPFLSIFILPYLFWFIYMGIGFVYLGIYSKQDYFKLCKFIFGGMCVCYIIYMIFPNAQNLRPIITSNDIFSNMVKEIYATDTPTNVAPSIHVFNSIAVHTCLFNCPRLSKKNLLRTASFVCMSLICASTVFIKQHSIMDVMYGILLGLVFHAALHIIPNRKINKALSVKAAV